MKNYPEELITAFLTSCHASDIMKQCKISKTKYYKLKADPDFQKILTERRSELIREAVMKMEHYLSEDVEILQNIITNPETRPQIKINGIQIMMNQLSNWEQTTEIMRRLEALEDQQRDEKDD